MGAEAESSLGVAGGEEVNVNIRHSNGSKFTVKTILESTVGEFKAVVAQNCDVPAQQQRLIYKGRILKDDQTLASYGLQADHTVHMVRGFEPAAASPPSSVPASAGNTNSPAVTQGGGPVPGGALGAPVGTRSPGLFVGLPEFEQVQQQLMQNPNMMGDIMNMPAIQNLMNNPEIVRSLIMSNPQMRDIIDRNPELGHVLNDPGILRQTLEAARNPELMREMMRNTDRAMSNIESSPEGFNMLRRMYENVQEPFLNATTIGSGGAGADAGSNPFAALLGGNQTGTQTRDGPNSAAGSESGTTVPNANPLPNPWSNTGGSQTNNATRTNPTGDARIPSVAGLAGINLSELDRIGMTDPPLSQLMQDPAVAQMTQSLLSNPQYINQILGMSPQLRSMIDMNPHLREMMQDQEFIRQLSSPETMQQMMGLQQQLSQLARQQSTQEGAQTGQGTQNNTSMDMLMNMFGGLGGGSFAAPNHPDVPPEQLYASQLSQLQEMGFYDTQENIRALRATAGNVHAAVERLLGNPGQ